MTEETKVDVVESQPLELSALGQALGREWTAVQSDLQRARGLLHEGMSRIQDFFDVLQHLVNSQEATLMRLHDADTQTRAAALNLLSKDHQRLVSERDGILVGLQLDDILGQLLDSTQQRAEGGGRISAALVEAVDGQVLMSRTSLHDRVKTALADADERAAQPKVSQETLSTGDVELF